MMSYSSQGIVKVAGSAGSAGGNLPCLTASQFLTEKSDR